MKCPHDGETLAPRIYEAGIEIDECPRCHGAWLDKGELERIQETVEHDYRAELKQIPNSAVEAYKMARGRVSREELACPRCGAELHQKEHGLCSQIWVDVCIECRGVWLDEGELEALEVFFEQAHADTPKIRAGFWSSLRKLVFYGIVPEE